MAAKGFSPVNYLRKSADLAVANDAFEAVAIGRLGPRPTHLDQAALQEDEPETLIASESDHSASEDSASNAGLSHSEGGSTTDQLMEPESVPFPSPDNPGPGEQGQGVLAPEHEAPRGKPLFAPVGWLWATLRRWVYRNFTRRIISEIDANADHRSARLWALITEQNARFDEQISRSSKAAEDLIREAAAALLARSEQVERTLRSDIDQLQASLEQLRDDLARRLEGTESRLAEELTVTGQIVRTGTSEDFVATSDAMRVRLTRDLGLKAYAEAKWLEALLGEQILKNAGELARRMDVISERLDILQAGIGLAASVPATVSQVVGEAREAVLSAVNSGRAQTSSLAEELDRVESYAVEAARRGTTSCGPWVLVRSAVGYVLCPSDDAALIATLVDSSELEPGTRKVIERLLGPGQCFVDVGANIGLHTIAAARQVGPTGAVFAFEASPSTRAALEESLWVNGLNRWVKTEQVAVFSASGEQELFLGRTSGHHSLFSDVVEQGSGESINVRTDTLDRLVPEGRRIDLIKIDVEGAELEVLAGGRRLLDANPDAPIIIEFGLEHLDHRSVVPEQWFATLQDFGARGLAAIDERTGALSAIGPAAATACGNVNLLVLRGETSLAGLTGK